MRQVLEEDPSSHYRRIFEPADPDIEVNKWHVKVQTYLDNQEELT